MELFNVDSKLVWTVLACLAGGVFTGGIAVGVSRRDREAIAQTAISMNKNLRRELTVRIDNQEGVQGDMNDRMTKLEQRWCIVGERLARIETSNSHNKEVLDKVARSVTDLAAAVPSLITLVEKLERDYNSEPK